MNMKKSIFNFIKNKKIGKFSVWWIFVVSLMFIGGTFAVLVGIGGINVINGF